ncbi:Acyltransferase family protein [compost metagenome]
MNELPNRVYSLDVLRGLAAFSVVFWHWQHFFYEGKAPDQFSAESQPLYSIFTLLYTRGNLAVELFFSISGFVFFWLFSDAISNGSMSARRFFVDRFSRLYPLHIVSFAAVGAMQFYYISSHPDFFVYQANDAFHALLNIFMITAWGFEKGWSFNAPTWSVSIEVMLYSIFFIMFKVGKLKYVLTSIAIIAGYFIFPENHKIGIGIFAFFCGGLAYLLTRTVTGRIDARAAATIATIVSVTAWIAIWKQSNLNMHLLTGIAFPSSVALLALLDRQLQPVLSKVSAIGDMSYSSYLLHFPLQMIFAMVIDSAGLPRTVFYNWWMLALFLAVLIPLCLASHRLFEVPAQRAIRKAYSNRQAAALSRA